MEAPCGDRLVDGEPASGEPDDDLWCRLQNRARLAVGLDNRARTVLVDVQDDEEAFDLEAEFERGSGPHASKQCRQREHQPARLE